VPGDLWAFFSEVATLLVLDGKDKRLPDDRETGETQHTLFAVYGAMIAQICMDLPGLPDPRTLRMSEIRFFYDTLRPTLRQRTKK
jgi:hypothetical protein